MTRSGRNRIDRNARSVARWSPVATVRQYRNSYGAFTPETARAFMRRIAALSPWFAVEFQEFGAVNYDLLAELLNRKSAT